MNSNERKLVRSVEDVRSVITYAKLDEADLKSESTALFFSHTLIDKDVKLMEVSKEILASLEQGESLVIKGFELDDAVVCTHDQTFEIKEAGTSNSLLVLPSPSTAPILNEDETRTVKQLNILGVYHTYYELRPTLPRLRRLRTLLSEHPYKGKALESLDEQLNLTFAALSEAVQCSDSQILDALTSLQALKIRGHYRLFSLELKLKLMGQTMTFMESANLLNSIQLTGLLEKLVEEERREVVEHFFKVYFRKEDDILIFKEDEVCQLFAEGLLVSTSRFALSEFCTVWQTAVPAGLKTRLDQLAGLALIEPAAVGSFIKFFPEYNLPEDISERLAFLFLTRKKWSLQDLTPYIQPLATAKQDVKAILTKYARASTENGVKFFSAKHG
nr:EOG090X09TV [Lepidurus arcticus]